MKFTDNLKSQCWNKAINCLATSYIFQRKARKFGWLLRINNILGIIVPLLAGAIVLNYGKDAVDYLLWIGAPLSVLQIGISGFALIDKWEHTLSYSFESMTENRILSEDFVKLIQRHNNENDEDSLINYEKLLVKDSERTRQDEKVNFSDNENKIGMRYALMILQINCAVCKEIPKSMLPSNCNNCGNFKNKIL